MRLRQPIGRNRLILAGMIAAVTMTLNLAPIPAAAAQATDEPEVGAKGVVDDDYGPESRASQGPAAAKTMGYSPYAGRKYQTRVYFGETHHHTANSGDAYMGGDRLTPEQSYRFARGEEVVSSSGVPAKLARPLDFLVVSDHAEGLGIMNQVADGNPALVSDPTLARWGKALKEGGKAAGDAMNELVSAQAQGTLPAPVKDPKVVGPVIKSVWQQYTATADRFNEPGRFTAMIGYEWTSVPGGNNLHRNVLFRDGSDKADQIIPFSAWQSEDPEKLCEWIAKYEQKTGGKMLAIPHNGNLSNGRMFELVDFGGQALTRDYAERRARWEPLQEIIQTKGNSETHPTLSPNDEFAGDLGIAGWDYGNLTLEDKPETPEMRPYMYLRGGLMRGLKQEQKLGVNPFKFGFVGSTDVHNSLTGIDEDNFFGKHVNQEPSPNRWEHVSKQGFGKTRYTWMYMAAGYAAVWATENTREALWDAMKRRETFGTSGSRMIVRFFGGWDYTPEDARTRYVADVGYAKGVPMGGDMTPAPATGTAPTFLVVALKDPMGANLDRIQIVKGWVDGSGKAQEKEHDGHIGQLLDKLDALGIADDTIVVYTTDNGAEVMSWPDGGTTTFHGEKNTSWEGGYRVPLLMRYPKAIKAGTVVNGIVSHEDFLPTLLGAVGEPDIKEKLRKGHKVGKMTYKVHLDGHNFVPFITQKEETWPRREFFYFTDGGELAALRVDHWKVMFLEQRAEGADVWSEPFVPLRAPWVFHLRTDPLERALHEGIDYKRWWMEHMFVLVPAQAIVQKFMSTFKEFPPRQKPGSFSIDKADAKITEAATSGR